MNTRHTVILAALMMLFSSMAGCLDRSDDDETEALGKAMVSTYHVGQLVSAIGGDSVTVEYMAPSNVPVHDYEPSAADIVRLQESDIFLYHGLNLEPWVETALSSLGDNAPTSVQTHAMPAGQSALDYETMLIEEICEHLGEGPYEASTLTENESEASSVELHAEHVVHRLTMPAEDHEEGEEDDDHSAEEADAHEDHGHVEPEETIQDPAGCPSGTTISIFHLEDGEYVLEFESEDLDQFDMMALKMGGGHAHHGHGHDEGVCHDTTTHSDTEHDSESECEAAGHMWKDGHEETHGDVCHDTTTHNNTEHDNEADCEAAGHTWMEDDDDDHDEEGDDHDEEGDDHNETVDDGNETHEEHEEHHAGFAQIHVEEEGEYGFAIPSGVGFNILAGEEGHDDHGDHEEDDDHSDEEDDDHSDEGEIEAHDDEEFNYDPHSWLDPLAFKEQAKVVLEALKTAFPSGESDFTANAESYMSELDSLHADFESAFPSGSACTETKVVANHNAYSYLAKRYDLEFISVHGIDPEGEPSAADIAEVVEEINEGGITVLFIEEYTSASAVDSIVQQTTSDTMPNGVGVEYLYTMELEPKDPADDYISLMRKSMESLKDGLGC